MAGMAAMSCVVVDRPIPPGELLALQCVENLLREDLRPVEEAKAFRTLRKPRATFAQIVPTGIRCFALNSA